MPNPYHSDLSRARTSLLANWSVAAPGPFPPTFRAGHARRNLLIRRASSWLGPSLQW